MPRAAMTTTRFLAAVRGIVVPKIQFVCLTSQPPAGPNALPFW
jgi:hypothetical protein